MYIVSVIITLLFEFELILLYGLPNSSLLVFIITVFFAIVSIIRKVHLSIAGWGIYAYLFFSFIVVSLFKYTTGMSLGYSYIQDSDFAILANVSIWIFFVFFISICLFCSKSLYGDKDIIIEDDWAPSISFWPFFIIAIISTILSSGFGIGRMGTENTKLPFHLSGILQFYRVEVFPLIMLCCYVNGKNPKNGRGRYFWLFLTLYFIWAIVECFVRYSKSAILTSLLPILIYEMTKINSAKSMNYKVLVPVIALSFIIYPMITTIRTEGSINNIREGVSEHRERIIYGKSGKTDPFVEPFTRVFLSGYLFLCDLDYIDPSKLFDTSKARTILALKGSARFQTLIIDGYSSEAHHSSGSTPFIDALLTGGYGLFLIVISLYVFFASRIDSRIMNKDSSLITTVYGVVFYRSFDMLSVSFFVDPMCQRFFIVYFLFIVFLLFKSHRSRYASII